MKYVSYFAILIAGLAGPFGLNGPVRKARDVISAGAGEYAPENLLDDPVEVIVVERK
ncbi:MAG: hypothetical protein ABI728_05840 [Betaproteobacteria bacterium]